MVAKESKEVKKGLVAKKAEEAKMEAKEAKMEAKEAKRKAKETKVAQGSKKPKKPRKPLKSRKPRRPRTARKSREPRKLSEPGKQGSLAIRIVLEIWTKRSEFCSKFGRNLDEFPVNLN